MSTARPSVRLSARNQLMKAKEMQPCRAAVKCVGPLRLAIGVLSSGFLTTEGETFIVDKVSDGRTDGARVL